MDLPGTYALGSTSEDQWVARHALLDFQAGRGRRGGGCDATGAQPLPIRSQLLDLRSIRLLIALNLLDEAWRQGPAHRSPASCPGCSASPWCRRWPRRGQGLGSARGGRAPHRAASGGVGVSQPRYGKDVEEAIGEARTTGSSRKGSSCRGAFRRARWPSCSSRTTTRQLAWMRRLPEGDEILAAVREVAAEIVERAPTSRRPCASRASATAWLGQLATQVKSQDAGAVAGAGPLLAALTTFPRHRPAAPPARLSRASSSACLRAGISSPGCWSGLWGELRLSWHPVRHPGSLLGEGLSRQERALGRGRRSGYPALAVGIPYVLTFYLILSILEDTGYLNSIAFLTDPFMHKLGLHGRAVIPVLAGARLQRARPSWGRACSARCASAFSPARSCA